MRTLKQTPTPKTSYMPMLLSADLPESEHIAIIRMHQEEISRLHKIIEQKNLIIHEQDAQIQALTVETAHLKGINEQNKHARFGRSSEKEGIVIDVKYTVDEAEQEDETPSFTEQKSHAETEVPARKRGAKFGHKGHGRVIPDLPQVEEIHEIPKDQKCCGLCGLPYEDIHLTEVSHEVDIKINVRIKKHIRKRAIQTCTCPVTKIITAPKPSHIIPKSMFSHAFIVHLIVMKYLFQIPLHRTLCILEMQGLSVLESTIIGIFKKLHPLLERLYKALAECNREAAHWHADETGWKCFVQIPGKDNANWWLWVFAAEQTTVYVLDSSRSSTVPYKHFKEIAWGIVSCDRYSAYTKLASLHPGIILALCWAHFRRDFINAAKAVCFLQEWAKTWVKRIGHLYAINHRRMQAFKNKDETAFAQIQCELEQALQSFAEQMKAERAASGLHPKQEKILKNALKNWDGFTVFAKYPHVPMDNNTAERRLRPGALGRKNYYGSHAKWSGEFMAICMSLLQTAVQQGLNPEAYMCYVLDVLAEQPKADAKGLLPMSLSPDIKVKLQRQGDRQDE